MAKIDMTFDAGGGTEFEKIDFHAPSIGENIEVNIKGMPKSILIIEGNNVAMWAWSSYVNNTDVVLLNNSSGISLRQVGSTSGSTNCIFQSIQNGKLVLHIWSATLQNLQINIMY